MANTYEKLVAAGAPEIVEPRFYRIAEDYRNGELIVEVRERLPYKGSKLLASDRVNPLGASNVLEDVVETLGELVDLIDLNEAKAAVTGEFGPGA